jgi:hypothetical protein
VFAIEGSNFFQNGASTVQGVSVGGKACTILYAGKNTVIAILPAGRTNEMSSGTNLVQLALTTTTGVTDYSGIRFDLGEGSEPEYPSVAIERGTNGMITNLTVLKSGMELTNLLDALKGILGAAQTTNGSSKAEGSSTTTNMTVTLSVPMVAPSKP